MFSVYFKLPKPHLGNNASPSKAKGVNNFLWKHSSLFIDYSDLRLGGMILMPLGQVPKISVRYCEIRNLDKMV